MVVVETTTTTPTTIANQFDIVDVDAAKAFMKNYQDLVKALLDDTDYQPIQGKKAKKKSAWRKLATAFNISDDVVHHEETRDETGQIVSAKFFVKATLPNGRSAVAVGKCSIYDKIRYRSTPKKPADKDTPSNFELRGRFNNAEHDVPATAHTRAKSRAIADLIGSGEAPAEELDEHGENSKDETTGKKRKKKVKKTTVKTAETEPIETKATIEDNDETPIVEAELVTNEEPKEKKAKKKTIKQLKEENETIAKAIEQMQANKTKVTRENLVDEILKMYENEAITLDEYRNCKEELVG